VRFNADGSRDTHFGRDGTVITNIEGRDFAEDVAIQADGKIIVLGKINRKDGYYPFTTVLVRYNAGGTIDSGFGNGGKVTNTWRWDSEKRVIKVQPDGKILIAGTMLDAGNRQYFGVARHNSDGSLDTTFGKDGIVTTGSGISDNPADMLIQPNGQIVVAGYGLKPDATYASFALVRYNTDGTLDPNFGKSGIVFHDFGFPSEVSTMALQTDGKIVVVGSGFFQQTPTSRPVASRYNSDGSIDSTFAGGDKVPSGAGKSLWPRAITIQLDGKIVIGGYGEPPLPELHPGDFVPSRNGPFDFMLVRYLP
jgi:uncharacterized delta-60 repeat protein